MHDMAQQQGTGSRLVAAAVVVALVAFMARVAADLLEVRTQAAPYWIADWQINYVAGFVRRGLAGDFALTLRKLFGIDTRMTVVALQLAAFALFFGALAWLVPPVLARHPMLGFAAFSPIAFSFKALDVHPGSTGAKEIVLLAALAAQALLSRYPATDPGASNRRLAALAAVWAVLTLVHEALFFFLPFSCLIIVLTARREIPLRNFAWMAFPAGLVFGISALFHGDSSYSAAICESLDAGAPEACTQTGAIAWLNRTARYAFMAIYYASIRPPYILLTTALVLTLAGAGFALVVVDRSVAGWLRESWQDRRARLLAAACLVLPLPMFLVFSDHGRLLHIWFTCAALALVSMVDRRGSRADLAPASAASPALAARLLWIGLFAVYATSWNARGPCCPDGIGNGFLGQFLLRLTSHL